MQQLTTNELKEKIKNKENFVIDFFATWCGPCKILKPIYEKVAQDLKTNNSDVSLYTMNVDSNRDLVMSLGIRSVPTIKSFSNGKEVTTKVGVLQEGQLHDLAKNLING